MNNWISVEDDLPEYKDDGVLVHFENGSIETVNLEFFSDVRAGLDEDGNQLWSKYYENHDPAVTHWMQLPSPPKGK